MKDLSRLTEEEIGHILILAMDDDEWHTPRVEELKITEQCPARIVGNFIRSKHNSYSNILTYFSITSETIKLWEKRMRVMGGGGSLKSDREYLDVENTFKIANTINELPEFEKPTT